MDSQKAANAERAAWKAWGAKTTGGEWWKAWGAKTTGGEWWKAWGAASAVREAARLAAEAEATEGKE